MILLAAAYLAIINILVWIYQYINAP